MVAFGMSPRRTLLFTALAAALAAAWWVSEPRQGDGPELVQPLARTAKRGPEGASQEVEARGAGQRISAMGRNLFPPHSWQPPPPPKAIDLSKLPPPPPPAPPPLPFTYVGRWQEGGKEALFLNRGDQLFIVHPGEVVTPWRVDAMTVDSVTFTYLPLDRQQTMRLMP